MIEISFYSIVFSILVSSLLVVLIYFFRKKETIANVFGVYTMIGLYAATFVRLILPIDIKYITCEIPDYYVYPRIVEFLTPDVTNIIVPGFNPLYILILVWGTGTVIFTVRFFVKYFKAVKRLTASAINADDETAVGLNEIASECGIKRKVKALVTDRIDSPMTYGFFKPVVLFPVYCYSDKEFYYIARHECCHIKNKDIWVKLLIEIYCALFWWNPLVYLLKKDLVGCLETRCDNLSLKHFSDNQRYEYADILVSETKRTASTNIYKESQLKSALIGFDFAEPSKKNRIIQRVKLVVNPKGKSRKNSIPIIVFCVLFASVFILSYLFYVSPAFGGPTYEDCIEGLPEEEIERTTFYDETKDMYVYEKNDGTYILIFEPYDEKKGVVITDENSFVIPPGDIKEGYYRGYKFVKED